MDLYEPGTTRPKGTYRCEYCGRRAHPRCEAHPAASVVGPCTPHWDALIDTWAREGVERPAIIRSIYTRTPAGHKVGELDTRDQEFAWNCYKRWGGLPERKPYGGDDATLRRRADLLFGGKI